MATMATTLNRSRAAVLLTTAVVDGTAATTTVVTASLAVMTAAFAATTIIAPATTIATTRATVATMATMAGDCNVLTAQEGDAQDRDEDRDTENQCTIHPRILQQKKRNVRSNSAVFRVPPDRDGRRWVDFLSLLSFAAPHRHSAWTAL